jgi:hypothetical protein
MERYRMVGLPGELGGRDAVKEVFRIRRLRGLHGIENPIALSHVHQERFSALVSVLPAPYRGGYEVHRHGE